MERREFLTTMAKLLRLGDIDAARLTLATYANEWPSLGFVQEGVASAERELRRRAGLPEPLAPMAEPYVDLPLSRGHPQLKRRGRVA